MSYRLSPDFDWRERGNVIQMIKRGKSYSEVARFYSRKKRKGISWTTIRSICQRAGVKSVHPNTGKGKVASESLYPTQENQIVKYQKKWSKTEIAFIIIFIVAMILLGLAEFYGLI